MIRVRVGNGLSAGSGSKWSWRAIPIVVFAGFLVSTSSAASTDGAPDHDASPSVAQADSGAAARVGQSLPTGPLRRLIDEVLQHNPDLGALEAAERGAWQRPSQARALPDPMLGVIEFAAPPQTRVGPQEVALSLSQKLPWFGKLGLRGRSAEADASGASARLDAGRLQLVTETRRLYYELAYNGTARQIVQQDRATLAHYEELARSRYESGVGLEQAVIKIQAEITKADARLIDLDTQRAGLLAQVNALRDQPEDAPIEVDSLPRLPQVQLDKSGLRRQALGARPEVAEAQAQVAKSGFQVDLARKQFLPDLTLGVSYTFVGPRTDAAGRSMPPEDNGSDIVGVSAGVNLPIWRGNLAAGVEEARAGQTRAEEMRRSVSAGINRSLGDLFERVPLTWRRLRLYEDVLGIQAEQSLRSAESAYSATTVGALDLLDAERVLLDVRIATARARADYAIALAQLEGAVGAPVIPAGTEGEK